MSWAKSDVEHMQSALAEAEKGAVAGEVPVGAVLVHGDRIIARASNTTISEHDPAGHAEIVALRSGAAELGNHRLNGATLFVTLEPCAMCMGAIAQARLDRVVFAAYDPKAGACGSAIDLSDCKALNHSAEINGGLLEDEAANLLQAFFARRR